MMFSRYFVHKVVLPYKMLKYVNWDSSAKYLQLKLNRSSTSWIQSVCQYLKVKCLSLKRGIIQSNIDRLLWKVNQVIYIMYPNCMPDDPWYHDSSSSGSPDILFIMLLYHTKCQSWKREIIQPNIYRILPKVNHVIYNLDTINMPNIMILAQVVLKIFVYKFP